MVKEMGDEIRSDVVSHQDTDSLGNITGGKVTGVGLEISWQHGPLVAGETPNGAFLEGVIAACILRLEAYQATTLNCRENALAITKLEEATHWLTARRADRKARGVYGGYNP